MIQREERHESTIDRHRNGLVMRARSLMAVAFVLLAGCGSGSEDDVAGVYVVPADRAPARANAGLRRGSDELIHFEDAGFFEPACPPSETTGSSWERFQLRGKALYRRQVSGNGWKRIATGVDDIWPSPDGRRVVFARDNEAFGKLYVADADSTAELGEGDNPAWSPKSDRIAFDDGYESIWLVDSAGRHAVRLTRAPSGYQDRCATWVDRGNAIAFDRDLQQALP